MTAALQSAASVRISPTSDEFSDGHGVMGVAIKTFAQESGATKSGPIVPVRALAQRAGIRQVELRVGTVAGKACGQFQADAVTSCLVTTDHICEIAITPPVGLILPERNDAWAIQRVRKINPDSIALIDDDPSVSRRIPTDLSIRSRR